MPIFSVIPDIASAKAMINRYEEAAAQWRGPVPEGVAPAVWGVMGNTEVAYPSHFDEALCDPMLKALQLVPPGYEDNCFDHPEAQWALCKLFQTGKIERYTLTTALNFLCLKAESNAGLYQLAPERISLESLMTEEVSPICQLLINKYAFSRDEVFSVTDVGKALNDNLSKLLSAMPVTERVAFVRVVAMKDVPGYPLNGINLFYLSLRKYRLQASAFLKAVGFSEEKISTWLAAPDGYSVNVMLSAGAHDAMSYYSIYNKQALPAYPVYGHVTPLSIVRGVCSERPIRLTALPTQGEKINSVHGVAVVSYFQVLIHDNGHADHTSQITFSQHAMVKRLVRLANPLLVLANVSLSRLVWLIADLLPSLLVPSANELMTSISTNPLKMLLTELDELHVLQDEEKAAMRDKKYEGTLPRFENVIFVKNSTQLTDYGLLIALDCYQNPLEWKKLGLDAADLYGDLFFNYIHTLVDKGVLKKEWLSERLDARRFILLLRCAEYHPTQTASFYRALSVVTDAQLDKWVVGLRNNRIMLLGLVRREVQTACQDVLDPTVRATQQVAHSLYQQDQFECVQRRIMAAGMAKKMVMGIFHTLTPEAEPSRRLPISVSGGAGCSLSP